LFVEYAERDFTSPVNCHTFSYIDNNMNNLTQVNTANALHPDVIIRDHPDNPGVDYIVSVVYTDAGVVTLNNYEVIGLPTVTVNLMSSTALNTATHPAGSQGAYPKIDGFVNPNNAIHAYRAMGGFAVTWETSAGVELQ